MLRKILNFLRSEPALVFTAVAQGLALAAAFGLQLSPAQTKAVYGFTAALAGILIRGAVSPVVIETPAVPETPTPPAAA